MNGGIIITLELIFARVLYRVAIPLVALLLTYPIDVHEFGCANLQDDFLFSYEKEDQPWKKGGDSV